MSIPYDLVKRSIHVDDTDFVLSKKLFADALQSAAWKKRGHAVAADFLEFGKRISVVESGVHNCSLLFSKDNDITHLMGEKENELSFPI